MTLSTITANGQTIIPANILDFLHLHAGDKIEFIPQENGRVLLTPAMHDISELKGILPKPKKSVSLRAMEAAIRKRGSEI